MFTNQNEKVEVTGNIPQARFGHTITYIPKGKAILFGGATGDTGKYSITGDTFSFDIITRIWKKVETTGSAPSPRAAHSAVAVEINQIVIYGGATGGGSLASDDLYLLDMRGTEDTGIWTVVPVVGTTPGRRYGHTLTYAKPYLVVFGGNTGQEPVNDCWSLNVEKSPFSWAKIETSKGDIPSVRVYHSASLCQLGSANGMVVIFGGRSNDQVALNDTFGLRRHRDGRWDWVRAPSKLEKEQPTGRYQHSSLFAGSLLLIIGGRTNNVGETLGLEIYDTETSEWNKFNSLQRFRHGSWSVENFIYVYGGFELDSPNIPTETITRVNLIKLVQAEEKLFQKVLQVNQKNNSPIPPYRENGGIQIEQQPNIGQQPSPVGMNQQQPNQIAQTLNNSEFRQTGQIQPGGMTGSNPQTPPLFNQFQNQMPFQNQQPQQQQLGQFNQQQGQQQTMLQQQQQQQQIGNQGQQSNNYLQQQQDKGGKLSPNSYSKQITLGPKNTQDKQFKINTSVNAEENKNANQSKCKPIKPVMPLQDNSALHNVVLAQLLQPKNYINLPENASFKFRPEHIITLCEQAEAIIKEQPMVLRVRAPLKIFGDIHGQYSDLMRFFDLWGAPYEQGKDGDIESFDYLFLGDFVDRGSHSLETICLLMALKIRFPDQMHLIRGNHEDKWINNGFGFSEECASRLGEDPNEEDSVFNRVNKLFEWLPLATIIEDKIICLHGGIGSSLHYIAEIENLQRPLEVIHEVQTPEQQLVVDILWSDPTDSDADLGIQPNIIRDPAGTGNIVKFGPDRVQDFLNKNNLSLIIRAHECVMDGFERFAGGQLITVFSATDYCGRHKNAGAVLTFKKNFEIIPKLIYPNNANNNNWIEDEESLKKRPPTPPRWKNTLPRKSYD